MKILIISYYFPPMNSVASLRIFSWAKVWSDAGHKVTVLTVPKPTHDNLLPVETGAIEVIEASSFLLNLLIKILSTKYKKTSPTQQGSSGGPQKEVFFQRINRWRKRRGIMHTLRMPDFLSLWKRPALKKIRNRQFDVVVSSFGPYVTHLVAEKIIARNQATKWIADYRDLWIDHGLMKGLFPFTLIEKKLQHRINTRADILTTVSPPLAEALCRKGITRDKVHVIYNGYLEQTYSPAQHDAPALWNTEKIHLVYTGSIYEEAQDYTPFLNAIKLLEEKRPDLFLRLDVIIASRNAEDLCKTVLSSNVDECFTFTGSVSHQMALQMQKEADVLLFFDYNPRIMPGVITGKLFEYIVSGTEIWSIGSEQTETDSNAFLLQSKTGRILGNDFTKIYENLRDLLILQKKPLIENNMNFIKQFSREAQSQKMLNLICN